MGPPLSAKAAGKKDRWNGRSCAPTISGIFWQEYQSRGPRQRERASERAREKKRRGKKGRKKERERKKEKREKGRVQKDAVDEAWTLRLRDHRLTLSFIMFIPQTGIVPACMMYVYDVRVSLSLSLVASRDTHQVVIFARPQIVNEDINLVRVTMWTTEHIAFN